MKDQPANGSGPAGATGALGLPVVVDRAAFQAGLDYNTEIIEEFRANQGRVGGMWTGTGRGVP